MMIIVAGFSHTTLRIGFHWKIDKVRILGKEISFVRTILAASDEGLGLWSELSTSPPFVM